MTTPAKQYPVKATGAAWKSITKEWNKWAALGCPRAVVLELVAAEFDHSMSSTDILYFVRRGL